MTAASMCLAATLLGSAVAPADLPVVSRERGATEVSIPGTVLDHPVVRKELTSGLTNSFLCEVSSRLSRSGTHTSRTVVRVRYEPWDEVFEASVDVPGGTTQTTTVPSLEELRQWWLDLRLPLGGPVTADDTGRVTLSVQFVPFSRAEQEEAQRWITSALGAVGGTSPPPDSEGGPAPASAGPRLDSFLATSIRAQPMVTFSWTVPMEGGRPGGP